jgi:hypothetical protein
MPHLRKTLRLALGGWLALAAGVLGAAQPAPPVPAPATQLRVLFVGNSYTYSHELPDVVAAVAAARGIALVTGMLALPNYAIEDHLARRDYENMLGRGWDWVLLQQGPSSLPENQVNLRIYSGRAADLARARGIRVALWSAWPALDNAHTWAAAEASYRNAALANNLCVLPVATAWRLARERAPGVQLYADDRLHPERPGTLLAALVVAQGLVPRAHFEAPPNLALHLADPDWRAARNQVPLLDAIARDALGAEVPRCFRHKGAMAEPRER